MNDSVFVVLLLIGSALFAYKRFLKYLRFLQQENYLPSRFLKWVWNQRAFDRRATLLLISTALFRIDILGAIGLSILSFFEKDPRKSGKLTLKMTKRAKRIFGVGISLYLGCAFLWIVFYKGDFVFWLGQILLIQAIPLFLSLACYMLSWEEHGRQKQFLLEAKQILKKSNPLIIGITGSYGKTSTKEALGQILQVTLGPTFWPPMGVNTHMGIAKEVRENFKKGTKFAVMEIGAYWQGTIQRVCEFIPPSAAVITGVGSAHLERFGSLENIYLAKSELAAAVPQEGILICNGDNPGARRMAKEYPKKTTLLYGLEKNQELDCLISPLDTRIDGTRFTLEWQGKEYRGFTPQLGKPALSNLAAVFTMACTLGSNPEYVLAAMHHVEPIENRLQARKQGKVVFLRDAYNSNPIGFASALEVMLSLPGKRRILMTPGMIELGHLQAEQNKAMGKLAASVCDLVLIVNEENRKSLSEGLLQGGFSSQNVLFCNTRQNAFQQLEALLREEDIVLIENDLPDLYESYETF